MNTKIRHRFTAISGIRLHWAELGRPGSQPPLLLLHGLNDSHQTWLPIGAKLAESRLVLMPDMPGHGFSDRPDACYKLGWYANLINSWISYLSHSSLDVVGHSFGGGVGQMLLLVGNNPIRRLALIAPGGLGREITLILRLASLPHIIERLGQPFMPLATRLLLSCARDGRTLEDIHFLSSLNAQQGSARAFARTVKDIINWRGQRQIYLERIHEIRRLPPICILWGEHDRIIPAKHGSLMSEGFEGVRLVLFKKAGHYVHFEQPDLVTKVLKDFFDELSLSPAKQRRP